MENDDLDVIPREKRLHVERSSGAIKTACDIQIEGKHGPGQPNMTLSERDRCVKFNEVDPCDKDVWRSSVRSAMRAASQLPEGEPTDVDDAPALAC